MTLFAAVALSASPALADQTTGGIHWLDPAAYQKPAFVSITVPNEAAAPKYYVDLGNGSGTSCTQSSPCALASVAGKPGTSGGPAYVYIKGTGPVYLFNPSSTFYGSAGKEIVVKPWPVGTTGCASGCAATVTSSGVNNLTGSNVHHWIFDGGPDMGIKFLTTNDNGNVALRVNSNNHTFYRVQGTCNNNLGGEILMTSAGQATGLSVINSEFYDCVGGGGAQQSAIYMGGSSCDDNASGFTNFTWQNNIIRHMGGEGIELNPRTASSGATITGSAFHDIGKQTCNGSWDCRPAVTIDGPSCGGSSSNVKILNNLIFDIAAACIWSKGGGSAEYDNNTCYNYGQMNGSGACVEAICGGTSAVVKNNIIYAPNGRNPFSGASFTASNNVCGSGETCGTSKLTWSAATVISTSQTDPAFLRISSSSEAVGAGANLFSQGVTTDYVGLSRLSTGAFDVGAFIAGTASSVPPPGAPQNIRVIR